MVSSHKSKVERKLPPQLSGFSHKIERLEPSMVYTSIYGTLKVLCGMGILDKYEGLSSKLQH